MFVSATVVWNFDLFPFPTPKCWAILGSFPWLSQNDMVQWYFPKRPNTNAPPRWLDSSRSACQWYCTPTWLPETDGNRWQSAQGMAKHRSVQQFQRSICWSLPPTGFLAPRSNSCLGQKTFSPRKCSKNLMIDTSPTKAKETCQQHKRQHSRLTTKTF